MSVMAERQEQLGRSRTRALSAILISLIVHLLIINIMVFIPQKVMVTRIDKIEIDWFREQPKQWLRISRNKPPLVQRVHKPDEKLANVAKLKMAESPKNKIIEVVEAKDRIIFKNRDRQKAPSAEKIPDLMTAAKLRDAEASNLEHLLANPGETGGRGKVTGRDRMRGQRDGMDLVDSLGDSAEGLLGGGGNPGIADPLDIINFLSEFGGPQKVVFCLDVSASMSVPGLGRQKMELATSSIKDAMLALDDDDHFNIITFSATVNQMGKELIPCSMDEVMKAMSYLDRFTPQRIQENLGTDLLSAIEKGLDLGASILIVVTDGLPAASKNRTVFVETDPDKILQAVKAKNQNQANLFVVGLEIDLRRSPHAKLLVSLANQNYGKAKFIQTEQKSQITERGYNVPKAEGTSLEN
ncbi:hypothetical protein CMK14_05020 [Candidatus Poribacteria bacterium]|nr:hypothetical protein [Candidatus Poribacteria bacterium]